MRNSTVRAVFAVTTTLAMIPLLPGTAQKAEAGEPIIRPVDPPGSQIAFWIETSLKRVFPGSKPGSSELALSAARNVRFAFQACLRNDRAGVLDVECSIVGADDLKPLVRLVRCVPMPHLTIETDRRELDGAEFLPGLVPDMLWPTSKVRAGPYESRSFWITLNIPADFPKSEEWLRTTLARVLKAKPAGARQ